MEEKVGRFEEALDKVEKALEEKEQALEDAQKELVLQKQLWAEERQEARQDWAVARAEAKLQADEWLQAQNDPNWGNQRQEKEKGWWE